MKWLCKGFYDARVQCMVEVEADDADTAKAEAKSRIEGLDDIEEDSWGAGDILDARVTEVQPQ